MKPESHIPRQIIKNIAFFGDAHTPKSDPVYKDAFNAAKILAQEGFTIVNGGGPGIMNASTQGAEAGEGETLSVTFFPKDAPGFEGRYLGNITDEEIVTSNYIERMFKLMEHGDLFIIFKGGSGTISEFGTAWVLAKIYYGHHKPFILFGDFWIEILDVLKKNMNLDKQELSAFEIVRKVDDILPTVKLFEKRLHDIDHSKCKVCNKDGSPKNPYQN
jgi:predicted Rossmann-fold nucleotide-binding protein